MEFELAWKVLTQAVEWTERAVAAAKTRREQRFAHAVADAGILVNGLRLVDKQTHALFTPLAHYYPPAWDDQRRTAFVADLTKLAYEDEVLPRMRTALESLRMNLHQHPDPHMTAILSEIISLSETTCRDIVSQLWEDRSLGPWDSTSFSGAAREVLPITIGLLSADPIDTHTLTLVAQNFIHESGQQLRGIVNMLETEFGRLLALQQQEYPSLPNPDWVWK